MVFEHFAPKFVHFATTEKKEGQCEDKSTVNLNIYNTDVVIEQSQTYLFFPGVSE